jgi:hypothetical protein
MGEMALTTTRTQDLMPVMTIADAVNRYNAMVEIVQTVLKKDTDFGVIPGTGTKPTLYKAGAEKLSTFFGLSKRFQAVGVVEDWSGAEHGGEPFFYYRYQCQLWRSDWLVAEAEGSCNSWEKKYRYRQGERLCPTCGKPTIIKGKQEYGGGWLCFQRKGGCGAKFGDKAPEIVGQDVGQVKNPDVADVVNTVQKMAQKRAFVAATLLAVNASDFFTQDIEDMQTIPGDWSEVPSEPAHAKASNGNGNGHAGEPPMSREERQKVADTVYGKDDDEIAGKETPAKTATMKVRAETNGWRAACQELAQAHPKYQTTLRGGALSGQPNYHHILGAALKCGFAEVNDANYQAVIEAVAARAAENGN